MANTIVAKGKGHFIEGECDEACSPGMAMSFDSDGLWSKGPNLATAYACSEECVLAVENALQGETVSDAYADGDQMQLYIPVPGDECYILIKDGESIAIGDLINMEGGSTGLFVEAAGTEQAFNWRALAASAPSGANALCLCRKI